MHGLFLIVSWTRAVYLLRHFGSRSRRSTFVISPLVPLLIPPSTPPQGWKNAAFIATLLISVLLFVGFLCWELRLPPSHVRSPVLPLSRRDSSSTYSSSFHPQALLQVEPFTHLNFVLLLFMCLTPFNFFAGTQCEIRQHCPGGSQKRRD